MNNDINPYNTAIEQRQKTVREKFLETFKEMPIIEYACKKSNIGRTTYYRWRKEDIEFAKASDQAFRHGVEFINDMSEGVVTQLIKEKKLPACVFWLRNNSQRYGASRSIQKPALSAPELTKDEMKLFRKALALAGNSITSRWKTRSLKKK